MCCTTSCNSSILLPNLLLCVETISRKAESLCRTASCNAPTIRSWAFSWRASIALTWLATRCRVEVLPKATFSAACDRGWPDASEERITLSVELGLGKLMASCCCCCCCKFCSKFCCKLCCSRPSCRRRMGMALCSRVVLQPTAFAAFSDNVHRCESRGVGSTADQRDMGTNLLGFPSSSLKDGWRALLELVFLVAKVHGPESLHLIMHASTGAPSGSSSSTSTSTGMVSGSAE
mmetsp:Transcript_45235/g.97008  ORF Transcript_45235/g.97008 Transcript_45235/m.97008 type:complete len:234 (-) Transcript_45235:170-871(-)